VTGQRAEFFELNQRVPIGFDEHGSLYVLDEARPDRRPGSDPLEEAAARELECMLMMLPEAIRKAVRRHMKKNTGGLVEVVLGIGRPPEVRWRAPGDARLRIQYLGGCSEVSKADVRHVEALIGSGSFNLQDRAGIEGTLHRVSATRNAAGEVVILTIRVGRHSRLSAQLVADIVLGSDSVLFLGPPGVGKTTLLRACAEMTARTRSTVVVDPTGEIAGCGDAAHPAVGRAWKDMAYSRTVVDRSEARRMAMGRALENMLPQVLVVDEIGTPGEAKAARTIGERGVQLVATAHGRTLYDLLANGELRDLIGGLRQVTLGDDNPRVKKGKRKNISERASKPVFPVLVELRSPTCMAVHTDVARAVDDILEGTQPVVQLRTRDEHGAMFVEKVEV